MVRGSMMPVASVPGVPAQRPKVAFSIDSLVGDSADKAGTPSPQPPPTELRQPSACSPPRRDTRSPVVSSARSPPAVAPDPLTPDVLQQRLAHESERALHERLWRAHGLAGGLPALAAFGAASPLVRLPLADPRYTLKLAQLRGELLRPPGLLPPPQPPPAPSEMPLYPWLMSRHGRVFPGRYAPGPHLPEFLFQPFRKPKRIRTAFSPSQLLKLEHAFEKNHYVVGQERKQLAQSLSLSETQVKVWFQNRRTKHKRAAPDGEAGEGCTSTDTGSQEGADGSDDSETEDAAGAGIDVTN